MNVYEGSILSCNTDNDVFRFLVEDKGRILFAGNRLPEQYENNERVKLGKKVLLPSFADTHLHFSSFAFFSGTVDVRSAKSNRDIVKKLIAYRHQQEPPFILAFGASAHSVKEKSLITKSELDKGLTDIPVMIIKYDGHASINNSTMLDALPARIREMRGYHEATGELNQESFFAATDFITKKVSPVTLVRRMMRAYDILAEKGIGMIHTVEGVGFPHDLDVDTARFVARGQSTGFQTRVFFQTMDIAKVQKRKLPRIGGCFATALDGCFGSLDAALRDPYLNSKNRGVLFYAQEQVDEFCRDANRSGLQIEMHAIGDAAFDQAVQAIDSALRDFPREDHRHTIIHACLPTQRGLEICAKRGIGIAAQSAFLNWDLEPDEYLESILGSRTKKILPLRTMRRLGIHVSFGSDAPCTLPDPIEWMYNACNHPVKSESISAKDALAMLTREAAWMSFDDHNRGTLEKGKIADMVILSHNPVSMPAKDLKKIKVEKLILSGREYRKGASLSGMILKSIRSKEKI